MVVETWEVVSTCQATVGPSPSPIGNGGKRASTSLDVLIRGKRGQGLGLCTCPGSPPTDRRHTQSSPGFVGARPPRDLPSAYTGTNQGPKVGTRSLELGTRGLLSCQIALACLGKGLELPWEGLVGVHGRLRMKSQCLQEMSGGMMSMSAGTGGGRQDPSSLSTQCCLGVCVFHACGVFERRGVFHMWAEWWHWDGGDGLGRSLRNRQPYGKGQDYRTVR